MSARSYASEAKASPTEVSSILEQRIRGVQEESGLAETGRVLSVGYVGPTKLLQGGIVAIRPALLGNDSLDRKIAKGTTD